MKLTKEDEQALNAHSEAIEQTKKEEELPESVPAFKTNRKLADFFERGKRKPATPTYFNGLDQILGGGLQGGSLYTLGAISSLGKTTFALNIVEQIIHYQSLEERQAKERIEKLENQYQQAKEKGDHQLKNELQKEISAFQKEILFFSLEMSREELLSKVLSKKTFCKDKHHALTALQIMQNPSGLREEQQDNFYNCTHEASFEKLYTVEGIGNITTEEIKKCCERHKEERGAYPIIFIDYLQMLAPINDRYTDKQSIDMSVLELKRIARDFDIPVFVISSLNRESYKDEINMTSFKESGAIEYSSDVLLGMQLAGLKDAKQEAGKDHDLLNQKIAELKQGENGIREIEIKVLKNRNGVAGSSIQYQYNAQFNYFEEQLKSELELEKQPE